MQMLMHVKVKSSSNVGREPITLRLESHALTTELAGRTYYIIHLQLNVDSVHEWEHMQTVVCPRGDERIALKQWGQNINTFFMQS